MSDGQLPTEDEVSRLTDKLSVVGVDASEYDAETYQYNGTFKIEYLRQALDLVETLGWDEVNLGSIVPPENDDGGRLLLVTPDCEHPWSSDDASVVVAGRREPAFAREGGADDE